MLILLVFWLELTDWEAVFMDYNPRRLDNRFEPQKKRYVLNRVAPITLSCALIVAGAPSAFADTLGSSKEPSNQVDPLPIIRHFKKPIEIAPKEPTQFINLDPSDTENNLPIQNKDIHAPKEELPKVSSKEKIKEPVEPVDIPSSLDSSAEKEPSEKKSQSNLDQDDAKMPKKQDPISEQKEQHVTELSKKNQKAFYSLATAPTKIKSIQTATSPISSVVQQKEEIQKVVNTTTEKNDAEKMDVTKSNKGIVGGKLPDTAIPTIPSQVFYGGLVSLVGSLLRLGKK